MKTRVFIVCLFLFIQQSVLSQELYQVSYYQAIYSGKLDGIAPMAEVLKHGNFGIGGFDALNGEMILLDGKMYQVLASGKIIADPDISDKTPFAAATFFVSQKKTIIMVDSTMYRTIDTLINNPDVFVAVKISGTFGYIKTRSVPKQSKPYRPLSEIAKTQPVFEGRKIKGTMVGFRSPLYAAGINPPGYHMHFISEDVTFGGHVLEAFPEHVICEIMIIKELRLKLMN
jgi:acetolactate decarboxylase